MFGPDTHSIFKLATGTDEVRRELFKRGNKRVAADFLDNDSVKFQQLVELLQDWPRLADWRHELKEFKKERDIQGRKLARERNRQDRVAAAKFIGQTVIDAAKPRDTAAAFKSIRRPYLTFWGGEWFDYAAGHYTVIEDRQIRADVQDFMASCVNATDAQAFNPDTKSTNEAMDFLKSGAFNPAQGQSLPLWIDRWDGVDPEPKSVISCANGLLWVGDGRPVLYPPDARFFTRNALPFAYDPAAPAAVEWLKFLESIWPVAEGGRANHHALQEVMGYLLVPQGQFQKIFLFVGAPRAGKTTIQRVIEGLIGSGNIATQSITKLGREFGLESIVGKQVLMVPDFRLAKGADQHAVMETLLTISGQDTISIGRKFLPDLNLRPTARILMTTNKTLVLPDQSGALAARLFPFVFTKSFVDREDTGLMDRLLGELPSILNWALDGLARLLARRDEHGRQIGFVMTPAGKAMVDDIKRRGSSVKAFLAECCVMSPDLIMDKEALLDAYNAWAEDHEVMKHSGLETFTKELQTASGELIQVTQKRVNGARARLYKGVTLNDQWAAGGY